jgi:hypothetical protein
MSSLSQLLERRSATENAASHACHSINPEVSSLVVTTATGECWILPWHQLTAAHLTSAGGRDQLRLIFSGHEVTMKGHHLEGLSDLIATVRLATVRPAPTKYSKSADKEPFIDSIQVTAVASVRDASMPKGAG